MAQLKFTEMKRPAVARAFSLISAFFLLLLSGNHTSSSFHIFSISNTYIEAQTAKVRGPFRASALTVEAASRKDCDNGIGTNRNLEDDEEKATETISFMSNPKSVYIEDTDAYGVMYNGNYIKSYERALHEFHTRRKWESIDGGSFVIDDPNFYLTRCTEHKFKSSPALGSQYVVKGSLVHQESESEETWSLEMVEYIDSSEKERSDKIAKVYNTAQITISVSTKKFSPILQSDSDGEDDRKSMQTRTFIIHRDEFDIHMPGAIPMSTALTFFERARSDILGGPDQLRRMQEEDNILWVVTSLDDLKIDTRKNIQPGDELQVIMYCTVKRKGMIIICDQTISKRDSNGSGDDRDKDIMVLARGTCTICAIDSIRGRPTSNIPQHVKQLFAN